MKTFNIIKWCKVIVFSLLYFFSDGHSQVNNSKYRLAVSHLNDHSLDTIAINYEFGSVKQILTDQIIPIEFERLVPDSTFDSYFKSRPFKVSTSSDSISFFRFASFPHNEINEELDITDPNNPSGYDTAKLFPNARAMAQKIRNTGLYIKPPMSFFEPMSFVFFVVELHRKSDDKLLQTIDTLHCFRDPDGQFRYTIYPFCKGQTRVASIGNLTHGVPMYLTVHRYSSLPVGAMFVNNELMTEITGRPDGMDLNLDGERSSPIDRLDPFNIIYNPNGKLNPFWKPYRPSK